MYYYNVNGAALASLIPLEGLGPQVEPTQSWRLFAAVPGDPVLGRGSFKVTHPGQLLAGHGLETLDRSRLPDFDSGPASAVLSDGTTIPLELDENVRQAIAYYEKSLEVKPDNTGAMYLLGRAYQQTGDTDNANLWFGKIIDEFPDSEQVEQAKEARGY